MYELTEIPLSSVPELILFNQFYFSIGLFLLMQLQLIREYELLTPKTDETKHPTKQSSYFYQILVACSQCHNSIA